MARRAFDSFSIECSPARTPARGRLRPLSRWSPFTGRACGGRGTRSRLGGSGRAHSRSSRDQGELRVLRAGFRPRVGETSLSLDTPPGVAARRVDHAIDGYVFVGPEALLEQGDGFVLIGGETVAPWLAGAIAKEASASLSYYAERLGLDIGIPTIFMTDDSLGPMSFQGDVTDNGIIFVRFFGERWKSADPGESRLLDRERIHPTRHGRHVWPTLRSSRNRRSGGPRPFRGTGRRVGGHAKKVSPRARGLGHEPRWRSARGPVSDAGFARSDSSGLGRSRPRSRSVGLVSTLGGVALRQEAAGAGRTSQRVAPPG